MNHTCYYNRKGWYSIVLQAIVDHKYCFTDVYVGWPGSVHDARVLANSSVYEEINDGKLLHGTVQDGIPLFLLGDSAYPLRSWLMKPFPHFGALSAHQKLYNYRICRGRVVVEIAFGRLKARWRRLSKQNDMDVENVPTVVGACCTLHNICQVHGDNFLDEWLNEINDVNPSTSLEEVTPTQQGSGESTRQALMLYFSVHPL